MTRSLFPSSSTVSRLFSTKIGTRLFGVLSLISIIPVSVSILIALNASKKVLEEETMNSLSTLSHSMERRVEDYLTNLEKELTILISDRYLVNQMESRSVRMGGGPAWDPGPLNQYLLENRIPLLPEAYELAIADTHGTLLASSLPRHVGTRFASIDVLTLAKTRIYMGEVFVNTYVTVQGSADHNETSEIPSWYFYAPIRSEPGGPAIALLIASIDPAVLSTLLATDSADEQGPGNADFSYLSHTYVINGSGLIIASTHHEFARISPNNLALDSMPYRSPSDPLWSAGYLNHLGQQVIGKIRLIEGMDWVVVSEISTQLALEPYRRLQRMAVIGFIILLLIVLSLSTYLTNHIVKPLYRINQAHRALGEGDAEGAIIPPGDISGDEIGDLMVSHNEMLADLKKRSGQLQTALDSGQELLTLLSRPTREKDFLAPALESLCSLLDAEAAVVILDKGTVVGPSQSCYTATDRFDKDDVVDLINDIAATLVSSEPSTIIRGHDIHQSILDKASEINRSAMHSFLGVPIISRSQRYGRIFLLGNSGQQPFDVEDEQRAIRYANNMALLLDNISLIAKLQDSEASYRTLYDATPMMLFRSTMDGRLLECNPRFYKLLGYSSFAELASINLARHYYFPADRENLISELREQGHLENYEISLRDKEGNRRYFLNNLRISMRPESGDEVIDGILLEITAQRKAEEEKQALQAQLLEKHQTETIGTMAAGLAHEFNNLLMGMMSYAELGRMAPDSSPEQSEYFSNIISQSKRGAALISQILAYSRQAVMTTLPIQLEELIEPTINILRGQAKGIEYVSDFDGHIPPILADRTQLQVTISNLARNGQEAMPDGGTLTFAISRQEISGADIPASFDALPGEYICLDIIDTGVGIPEDMMKQVITPFFSTKPPGQGSGLGLSQAYGVVRQHNGFLTISSIVGAGTTVRLALPVAPQTFSAGDRLQSASSDVAPDGTFEGHGECVLLVEDSDLVRTAAIELLTSLGYETLAAASGEEGIEMFQQNSDQIQVVLSDLIMPGISGRELCQRIRRISPDVPLILFSGYTDSPEIAKMRQEGIIDGFLGKPFSAREMGHLLKTILN